MKTEFEVKTEFLKLKAGIIQGLSELEGDPLQDFIVGCADLQIELLLDIRLLTQLLVSGLISQGRQKGEK